MRHPVRTRFLPCFVFALTLSLCVPDARAAEPARQGLPLEPTRKLEYVLDQGTWLSLTVSPDGSEIIFELLGDLFRMASSGGTAVPVTSGMAFDSQPAWSPDGEWIAFLSDRDGAENLWIAKPDGSDARKLSNETGMAELASPAWFPDGGAVIVSKAAEGVWVYELWMYHLKGGSGVQITKAMPKPDLPRSQRQNALGPVVSPDGRYVYFARRTGGFAYNAVFPLWQVARMDLVTGDEDVLTQAPGSGFAPRISPDGRFLAYGTRQDTETALRIRDLQTGEDRELAFPIQRDDQESRFTRDLLPGYSFTPDGAALLLAYDGRFQRISVADGTVTPIGFSARINLELGPALDFPYRVEEGPVKARLIQDPRISPDGGRLACSVLSYLYVTELEQPAPVRLETPGRGAYQPAWSPDGKWLAYVSWDGQLGHLWKIPGDGSSPAQQLSRVPGFYADPVWTPDGNRIVLLRGSADDRRVMPDEFSGSGLPLDLIWIPADGGEAVLIAPSRGLGRPHFSREPDRIYVYGVDFFPEKGGRGLVSLRFDGTDRRTHLKVLGKGLYANHEPVGAHDARISPDGRWALANVQNQLYLVAVPPPAIGPEINMNSPTVPARRLTRTGADYFEWADGGETISWAIGSTLFRLALADVSFEPAKPPVTAADDTTPTEPAPLPEAKARTTPLTFEFPRAQPQGTVVLRGARLITMRGQEIIEKGDVVIRDHRIHALGPQGSLQWPAEARVIDLTGKTVIPGLIDTHAHWLEIRRGVLDLQNWSFLANLAYGVTTGLDVQTMTNDMFAYQDLLETGLILGPRAYSTGPGIFSDNDFKSLEEAKGVIGRYRDHYRTRNLKSYIVGNRKQRQWVAQAARELEMMPTTEGGLDLKLDLTHALDGFTGNEHSLPIVPLFSDVVRFYADSRIAYTPTLLVNYGGPFAENNFYTREEVHDDAKLNRFTPPAVIDAKSRRLQWFRRDEYVYPRTAAHAAEILRAGGRVGVGAHGQLQGLGYHWEMWALAEGGMSPLEVLRCATLGGAEIIGLAQDLGSIEPGKLADLVVLDANPLDDIRHTNSVRYVVKNGEVFEGESLNRIWPSPQSLPPLWWWKTDVH